MLNLTMPQHAHSTQYLCYDLTFVFILFSFVCMNDGPHATQHHLHCFRLLCDVSHQSLLLYIVYACVSDKIRCALIGSRLSMCTRWLPLLVIERRTESHICKNYGDAWMWVVCAPNKRWPYVRLSFFRSHLCLLRPRSVLPFQRGVLSVRNSNSKPYY